MPNHTDGANSGQVAWFSDHAPTLASNGYQPIPCIGKKPIGANWQHHRYSDLDLELHPTANIGILTKHTPALDVDILDPELSRLVFNELRESFPGLVTVAPEREGQPPKFLLLFRTDTPFPKRKLKMYRVLDDCAAVIEWLGDGQQFIALGDHPDTLKPYRWNGSGSPLTVKAENLPRVDAALAQRILDRVEEILTRVNFIRWKPDTKPAKGVIERPLGTGIMPATSNAPPWALEACSRLDSTDRDQWIRVGHILKAAEQQGADWARDCWIDWSMLSEAYQPGDEDRWDAFKPTAISNPQFTLTKLAGLVEDALAGFETVKPEWEVERFEYGHVHQRELGDFPFIVPGLIPRGVPTLFSAHGGAGKSYLNLQLAVCVAAGIPFLGRSVGKGKVIFYTTEEPDGEIERRLKRILMHYMLEPADVAANLEIRNGYGSGANILFTGHKDTGKRLTPNYHQFHDYCLHERPDLIIVDNVSEVFDANEIERALVRQFVQSMNALCKALNCGLILIGHVDAQTSIGKSAKGYSGSTAWHNSVRSRLFLKVSEVPGQVVLEPSKSNYGPPQEAMVLGFNKQERVWELVATVAGKTPPVKKEEAVQRVLRAVAAIEHRGTMLPKTASGPENGVGMLREETGLAPREIREALDRLFLDKLVEGVEYIKPDRHAGTRIVLTDAGRAQLVVEGTDADIGQRAKGGEGAKGPKGQSPETDPWA